MLGQQLTSTLEIVSHPPVFGSQFRGRLQFPVGPPGRRVALAVGDHLGIGELPLELGEAVLHL
jgi:hypothetical protein